MKTLQEIKDEYAKEVGFENWKQLLNKLNWGVYAQHDNDIVTRRFSIEVAKQALINASENAKTCQVITVYGGEISQIDKESILNESNIPTL